MTTIHEIEAFRAWANRAGYDTAHTYDTERSRHLFLNPMTADLWRAWRAAIATAQPVEPLIDALARIKHATQFVGNDLARTVRSIGFIVDTALLSRTGEYK